MEPVTSPNPRYLSTSISGESRIDVPFLIFANSNSEAASEISVTLDGAVITAFTVEADWINGVGYNAVVVFPTPQTGALILSGARSPRRSAVFNKNHPFGPEQLEILNRELNILSAQAAEALNRAGTISTDFTAAIQAGDDAIIAMLADYQRIGQWWPDGTVAALLFLENRYYSGQRITRDGVYSFDRDSAALFSDGIEAAADVLREEIDGLVYEPERTNLAANPTFDGATVGTVGSGGALPTATQITPSGLTLQIIEEGVEDGEAYIVFDVAGANGRSSNLTWIFRGLVIADYPVMPGSICVSCELTMLAKSGVQTSIAVAVPQYDVSNAQVANSGYTALTAVATPQIVAFNAPVTAGNKADFTIRGTLSHATNAFSCRFKLKRVQMEEAADALPTTWTAGTREADEIDINLGANGVYSLFLLHTDGGTWEDMTVTGNKKTVPQRGHRAKKLVTAGIFPPDLTFNEKADYATALIPPKYETLANDASVELSPGNYYYVQSPNKSWSVKRALNKRNHVRTEVRPGDKWISDGASLVSRLEFQQTADHTLYGLDPATGPKGAEIQIAGTFKLNSGEFFDDSNNFCAMTQVHARTRQSGTPVPGNPDPGLQPALIMNMRAGGLRLETRYIALDPPDNDIVSGTPDVDILTDYTPIVPGVYYYFWLRLLLGLNNDAELEFWINGVEVYAETGLNIGMSDRRHYVKFGTYQQLLENGEQNRQVDWFNYRHSGDTDLTALRTQPEDIC